MAQKSKLAAAAVAELVSQKGLIMFGLRDVWGFKSSFVWISGQILANISSNSLGVRPGNEGEHTLWFSA